MGYALVLLALLSSTAISGCTTISVSSDYDQSANFDSLKTYDWMTSSEKQDDTRVKNSLVMSRIQDAVDRQLDLKGYQKTPENPDFFVAYHASVDEKTQIHSTPYYGGGVGAYRFGPVYNNVYQTRYEEGTLIIDILNSETKKPSMARNGERIGEHPGQPGDENQAHQRRGPKNSRTVSSELAMVIVRSGLIQ